MEPDRASEMLDRGITMAKLMLLVPISLAVEMMSQDEAMSRMSKISKKKWMYDDGDMKVRQEVTKIALRELLVIGLQVLPWRSCSTKPPDLLYTDGFETRNRSYEEEK